ncbi:NADH-quinone oxidoreductase subunit E [Buchnera aphidicola (Neophyllaphis podocarpi)]|uniref:NADH-quinone oxidoreductase subunit NuoE n=1 Tax=Buchnera aphidicola TaxID=9 RepID=UPI003464D4C8
MNKKNFFNLDLSISPKKFKLSNSEIKLIEEKKCHYETSLSVSIEALKIVQEKRGWVSDDAIIAIANILNISPSEVESVATFYSQIFRQQVGRHIIRYCDSVVCYINNFEEVKKTLETELSISSGETTKDFRFTLLPICCLGNCDKGPVIMIDNNIHSCVTPSCITKILEYYR